MDENIKLLVEGLFKNKILSLKENELKKYKQIKELILSVVKNENSPEPIIQLLKDIPTKDLLHFYKTHTNFLYYKYDNNISSSDILFDSLFKSVLNTREHVLRNKDKKLISLMSKHAGRKLSLIEAQSLQNKLKATK